MIRNSEDRKKSASKSSKNRRIEESVSEHKKKSPSSGNGFYYSFLTVILLLCLVQISISAVLNISKIISYQAKIIQITKTRDTALSLNEQLKDNIKNFSKVDSLEAIARNNLKMSSEDEVLVIINTPKEDEKTEKSDKLNLINFIKKE